jgi:hypothetical protein
MALGQRQIGKRTGGRRESRPLRAVWFRSVGLWAALFAVFCQVTIPIGHDPIELLAGERCPGLDLPVAGSQHREAGSAQRTADAQPLQPAADGHGHTCPIFQTFTYLAPLGSSGPPPLPVPAFARSHHFLADWAGLLPAAGSFSRPFPRAPPARA